MSDQRSAQWDQKEIDRFKAANLPPYRYKKLATIEEIRGEFMQQPLVVEARPKGNG